MGTNMRIESFLLNIADLQSASERVVKIAKKTPGLRPQPMLGKTATPVDAALAEDLAAWCYELMNNDWAKLLEIPRGLRWMAETIGLARRVSDQHDAEGMPVKMAITADPDLRAAVLAWRKRDSSMSGLDPLPSGSIA